MKKWFIIIALLSMIGFFFLEPRDRVNVSKDLASFRSTLELPGNEAVLFDYLCKSRYWTVEDRRDDICASLSETGKSNLLPWGSSASMVFIFRSEPANRHEPSLAPGICNSISTGCKTSNHSQTLILSDNSMLTVNDHVRGKNRLFRKNITSYLAGIAHDIRMGGCETRLLQEDSIRTNYESFGIGDVTVLCSESPVMEHNRICGWINYGRRLRVSASIFDRVSGKQIGTYKAFRSRRHVGFSTNRQERFYFEIPLYVDGDGSMVDIDVKLHCGTSNVPIYATNATLQTWIK